MPVARSPISHITRRVDRERTLLERTASRSLRAIARNVRIAILRAYVRGHNLARVIATEFGPLSILIADAMLAAHLIGRLRSVRMAERRGRDRKALTSYDSALRFVHERLNLTPENTAAIAGAYGNEAARVTRQASAAVERSAQRAVRDIVAEGMHVNEGIARLRQSMDAAGIPANKPWILETLVRTNIQMAYSAGRFQANQDPAIDAIIWGYEYFTVGDDRVRPEHAALEGVRLAKDSPRLDAIWPPNGFNSFLPGTQVAGEFVTASKARYSGPIAQIQTRNGSRLSVTVNHPVLTPGGFVPAGQVREGDDLLQYGPTVDSLAHRSGDRGLPLPAIPRGTIDEQDMPAGIQDVFDAFSVAGTRPPSPRSGSLDFHGDARFYHGEVDVVWADGLLPNDLEALSSKLGDEVAFMLGTYAAPRFFHADGVAMACRAIRVGAVPKLDARRLQPIADDAARASETLRQLQDGNAGQVRFDKVASVDIGSWSGHVYDLQSPNGTIVANGLIVSNCRCTMLEIYVDDPAAQRTESYPDGPVEVNVDGTPVVVMPGPDKGFAFNPGRVFRDVIPTNVGAQIPPPKVTKAKPPVRVPLKPQPKPTPPEVASPKLTKTQEAAVKEYTGVGHEELNAALRGDLPLTKELSKQRDSIDAALKRLPKSEGDFYRVIDFGPNPDALRSFRQQHTIGNTVEWPAFTSASETPGGWKGAWDSEGRNLVRVTIRGKTAVPVKQFSINPGESEVLFGRNTRFAVENFSTRPDRGIDIVLREL